MPAAVLWATVAIMTHYLLRHLAHLVHQSPSCHLHHHQAHQSLRLHHHHQNYHIQWYHRKVRCGVQIVQLPLQMMHHCCSYDVPREEKISGGEEIAISISGVPGR